MCCFKKVGNDPTTIGGFKGLRRSVVSCGNSFIVSSTNDATSLSFSSLGRCHFKNRRHRERDLIDDVI